MSKFLNLLAVLLLAGAAFGILPKSAFADDLKACRNFGNAAVKITPPGQNVPASMAAFSGPFQGGFSSTAAAIAFTDVTATDANGLYVYAFSDQKLPNRFALQPDGSLYEESEFQGHKYGFKALVSGNDLTLDRTVDGVPSGHGDFNRCAN